MTRKHVKPKFHPREWNFLDDDVAKRPDQEINPMNSDTKDKAKLLLVHLITIFLPFNLLLFHRATNEAQIWLRVVHQLRPRLRVEWKFRNLKVHRISQCESSFYVEHILIKMCTEMCKLTKFARVCKFASLPPNIPKSFQSLHKLLATEHPLCHSNSFQQQLTSFLGDLVTNARF